MRKRKAGEEYKWNSTLVTWSSKESAADAPLGSLPKEVSNDHRKGAWTAAAMAWKKVGSQEERRKGRRKRKGRDVLAA